MTTDLPAFNPPPSTKSSQASYYKWNCQRMALAAADRQVFYLSYSPNPRTITLDFSATSSITLEGTINSFESIQNSLLDDPDENIETPVWRAITISTNRVTITTPLTALRITNGSGSPITVDLLLP